jgi:hypothetical protein
MAMVVERQPSAAIHNRVFRFRRLPLKQSFAARTLSSKSKLQQMIRPSFLFGEARRPPAAAGGASRLTHSGGNRERKARERHRFWIKQAFSAVES